MSHFISILASVSAVLFIYTGSAQAATDKIVCYYASWNYYKTGVAKYTLDDLPINQCTHIIYAFVVLDPMTMVMKSHDTWLDLNLDNLYKVTQLKKINPNLKVLLGVGGWTDSREGDKYSRLVKDKSKMNKFAKHAVQVLEKFNFDGLDLDWEYPAYKSDSQDKQGFTEWVRILHSHFSSRGYLLTTAVSAGKYNIDRGYDIPAIAPLLDFINVMTYDFHGSWEQEARHHSPLYSQQGADPNFNTEFAIDYWIQKGTPSHKLILGVPFYGRSWTLLDGKNNSPGAPAVGKGKAGKHTKSPGSLAYYECCLAHQQEGWVKHEGSHAIGPYLTMGDQWVGYDDVNMIKRKTEFAKDKQLGGVMIWDVTTDDFNNLCKNGKNPLLTAIYSSLFQPENLIDLTSGGFISNSITNNDVNNNHQENQSFFAGNHIINNVPNAIDDKFTRDSKAVILHDQHKSGGVLHSNDISLQNNDKKNDIFKYEWQDWPIFSESTTKRVTTPTTRRYQWQAWSIFQNSLNTTPLPSYTTTSSPTSQHSTHQTNGRLFPTTQQINHNTVWRSTSTVEDQNQNTIWNTNPERYTTQVFSGTTPIGQNQNTQTFSRTTPTIQNHDTKTSQGFTQTTPKYKTTRKFSPNSRFSKFNSRNTITKSSNNFRNNNKQQTQSSSTTLKINNSNNKNNNNNNNNNNNGNKQSTKSKSSPISSSRMETSAAGKSFGFSWLRRCRNKGYSTDPSSCQYFYRCTSAYAYKFRCPAGLLWNQNEESCVWPKDATC